jgi:hypothetical protein
MNQNFETPKLPFGVRAVDIHTFDTESQPPVIVMKNGMRIKVSQKELEAFRAKEKATSETAIR